MSIDLKTVKHISKLARISIDDEKANKLKGDLNNIFEFIEKLNELNTDNVQALTSIAETTLRFRKDEIKSENIREKILKTLLKKIKIFCCTKGCWIMSDITSQSLFELTSNIKEKKLSSEEITKAFINRAEKSKN